MELKNLKMIMKKYMLNLSELLVFSVTNRQIGHISNVTNHKVRSKVIVFSDDTYGKGSVLDVMNRIVTREVQHVGLIRAFSAPQKVNRFTKETDLPCYSRNRPLGLYQAPLLPKGATSLHSPRHWDIRGYTTWCASESRGELRVPMVQRGYFVTSRPTVISCELWVQRHYFHDKSCVTCNQASDNRKAPKMVKLQSSCAPLSLVRDLTASPTLRVALYKFINLCMLDGKKNKSNKIILNTLCRLGTKHDNVLAIFMKAVDNVKPVLEVRKIRISGSTQLVPSIIARKRQYSLALRWIIEAAKKRRNTKKNMSLDQCLFAEFIDAYQNTGAVRKKKDDLHKLAESNRGFAHYRWW